MSVITPFTLENSAGKKISFPSTRRALVCFIKEDCPTCRLVLPLLAAIHESLASELDFFIVGQTRSGNSQLMSEFTPPFNLLDDSALKVSFTNDIEIVPQVFLTDSEGHVLAERTGFVREEWQKMVAELFEKHPRAERKVKWDSLPSWRPGCGSLSVDPLHAERLQAEAENSPIRARRIEMGSQDDEFEFMFDQGFTDGLPVIPPTPERVLRMLQGTSLDSQDIIATMPPNMANVTVEKIAINAVMAGCRPEYLPVVMAAVDAVCTDEFNIHGVMATTMGASPVMIVNGPIRHLLKMNMGLGALGQGNRANATIGRALRLVIRNVGGAKPGGTERSTFSNPMKFTMCFAEWEERSCWDPFHIDRGFDADDSVVTTLAMSAGPTLILDETTTEAPVLAAAIGEATKGMLNANWYDSSNCLKVVSPEHNDVFKRGKVSKSALRRDIQRASEKSVQELIQGPSASPEQLASLAQLPADRRIGKFGAEDHIEIVVAGSEAGKCTAFFHGWIPRSMGSIPVSRKIDDYM